MSVEIGLKLQAVKIFSKNSLTAGSSLDLGSNFNFFLNFLRVSLNGSASLSVIKNISKIFNILAINSGSLILINKSANFV